MDHCGVDISPSYKGHVTPLDVLSTEGTVFFVTDISSIAGRGYMFVAHDLGFFFSLYVDRNSLFLERNGVSATLSVPDRYNTSGKIIVTAMWSATHLYLEWKGKEISAESDMETIPTAPTPRLIEWARRENLLRSESYESEESFRQKVYACLQSITDKIHAAKAYKSFWNVMYDGNRELNREPKKETEIQPLIHCLLSDQMLLNGIELIPEYQTGSGNVDFVFAGNIKKLGIRKFCAEFKLAHSNDLANGLWHQLPEYMRVTGSTYGAYCVLTFGPQWVAPVVTKSGMELDIFLNLVPKDLLQPEHDRIRSLVINLAKPPTASKLK